MVCISVNMAISGDAVLDAAVGQTHNPEALGICCFFSSNPGIIDAY